MKKPKDTYHTRKWQEKQDKEPNGYHYHDRIATRSRERAWAVKGPDAILRSIAIMNQLNFPEKENKFSSHLTPMLELRINVRDVIPAYVKYICKNKRITKQQRDSLISQLTSPDHENWYVALVIIKQIIKL